MAREQEKDLQERVLLVGVDIGEEDFERSMEELVSLARASERCVVGVITQRLGSVNKTFYVGARRLFLTMRCPPRRCEISAGGLRLRYWIGPI